jgi:hypothetical protein
MNATTPDQLALQTWQACQLILPAPLRNTFDALGPDYLKKKGGQIDISRIRILPKFKRPSRFWSSAWCYYEIGVGTNDGSALTLGGVTFLQFSNQTVCGAMHHYRPLLEILRAVQSLRPADFSVGTQNSTGVPQPSCFRRYRANPEQKTFPVDLAAKDLAWLIQETLPAIEQLSAA